MDVDSRRHFSKVSCAELAAVVRFMRTPGSNADAWLDMSAERKRTFVPDDAVQELKALTPEERGIWSLCLGACGLHELQTPGVAEHLEPSHEDLWEDLCRWLPAFPIAAKLPWKLEEVGPSVAVPVKQEMHVKQEMKDGLRFQC